jgi:hypothetical protein
MRQPAGLAEFASQKILDLGIQAPKVIRCPAFERGGDHRVKPQQEWFAIGH